MPVSLLFGNFSFPALNTLNTPFTTYLQTLHEQPTELKDPFKPLP